MEKLLVAAVVTLLALVVLYIFAIMPRMSPSAKRKAAKYKGLYIAHRGLHSDKIKENTAEAFKAAVDAGYGYELDVRVSADGVAIISHDATLKRVFGIDRRVDEMTATELSEIGVPTLAEALEIAGGRVPLVVELKMDDPRQSLRGAVRGAGELQGRLLPRVALHPAALMRWRKLMTTRGQLSARFKGKTNRLRNFILRNLLTNFRTRPDFIAYEHTEGICLPVVPCAGAVTVVWTVRSHRSLTDAKIF